MISILAPSKTLDFSPAPAWIPRQSPHYEDDARRIVETLRTMSCHQLSTLLHVSDTIAKTNHERLQTWGDTTKPALWAYRGDVYKGMYADRLSAADAAWAERHIRIISGLYGLLRPYDQIAPYRLEMKTKLAVAGARDLYVFWGERLARAIDAESDGVICVLSSNEYARPITKYAASRIVTPVFMDHKPNGTIGQVPIYSKMMRGVMARWVIDRRVDTPAHLKDFSGHGYAYDAARSTAATPVFVRPAPMVPLVF